MGARRAAGLFGFLLFGASFARAVEIAMPASGRGPGVIATLPGLMGGQPLQRGLSQPALNTGVDVRLDLPALLRGMPLPAAALGFQRIGEALPSLPRSAVPAEAAHPGLLSAFVQSALPSSRVMTDVSRRPSPAAGQLIPAMRGVELAVERAAEGLKEPMETISRMGPAAPSAEEFRRAGDRIWDRLGAAAGAERDEPRRHAGEGESSTTVAPAPAAVLEATGSVERGMAPVSVQEPDSGHRRVVPGYSSAGSAQGSAQGDRKGESDAREEDYAQADWSVGAVALLTMDVVGQSLILSDGGLLGEASRGAAAAVSGAFLAPGGSWQGVAAAERRRSGAMGAFRGAAPIPGRKLERAARVAADKGSSEFPLASLRSGAYEHKATRRPGPSVATTSLPVAAPLPLSLPLLLLALALLRERR